MFTVYENQEKTKPLNTQQENKTTA